MQESNTLSQAECFDLFQKRVLQLLNIFNVPADRINFYMGFTTHGRKKGHNTESGVKLLLKQLRKTTLTAAERHVISLVVQELKKEYRNAISKAKPQASLLDSIELFPETFNGRRALVKNVQFESSAEASSYKFSESLKSVLKPSGQMPNHNFITVPYFNFQNIMQDDKHFYSLNTQEKKWLEFQSFCARTHQVDQGNGAFIPPLQIFNSRWEQSVSIKSLKKTLDCDFKSTYFESEKKNSAFEYEVYTQNENRLALLPSLIEYKGMYELRHKSLLCIGYNSPHFAVNVQQLAGHIFENTFRVCSIGLLNSILENDNLSEDLEKPKILPAARAINWLSLNDIESAITDKNKLFSKNNKSKTINIAKIA